MPVLSKTMSFLKPLPKTILVALYRFNATVKFNRLLAKDIKLMLSNKNQIITLASLILLTAGCTPTTESGSSSRISDYRGSASITQGLAKTLESNLFTCENGRSRVAGVGEIADSQGKVWTVPADNHFTTAPKAVDLYEECANITPQSIADIDQASIPVAVIDADGEEITGYIFADNYFELYINGTLVAVDTVPFTPFNSSIVKFKVSKPYTIAVKVIDWEENLGLGTEDNRARLIIREMVVLSPVLVMAP